MTSPRARAQVIAEIEESIKGIDWLLMGEAMEVTRHNLDVWRQRFRAALDLLAQEEQERVEHEPDCDLAFSTCTCKPSSPARAEETP